MGSSSSKDNVKSINLEQNGDKQRSSQKETQQGKEGKTNDTPSTYTKAVYEGCEAVGGGGGASPGSGEVGELTRQLCESEAQRLDLEDRLEVLEGTLERLQADTTAQQGEHRPCDETLHAKDQYIANLQKENTDLHTQLNKMRVRQKRRVKQHSCEVAELKQEANFRVMELQEEITCITQASSTPPTGGSVIGSRPTGSAGDEGVTPLPGGEKMKLILELSEQVTEQGDKINKLEKALKQKDFTIDELRTKLRNNTQYLKAIDEQRDSARGSAGDRNNNSATHLAHPGARSVHKDSRTVSKENNNVTLNNRTVNKDSFRSNPARSAHVVKPAVPDAKDDFNETKSMKKLTSMLQGVRAKNDIGRISIDSIDEPQVTGISTGVSIVEEKVGSGRDSGLGSAGKREETRVDAAPTTSNNLDWNSLESGLSDSDADGSFYLQSKIFSAPPTLQGGKNSRPKKKTSSLKKRSSQRLEDKPPKPGLAFVSQAEKQGQEEGSLWDGHPLSPIMSPVEVA